MSWRLATGDESARGIRYCAEFSKRPTNPSKDRFDWWEVTNKSVSIPKSAQLPLQWVVEEPEERDWFTTQNSLFAAYNAAARALVAAYTDTEIPSP
jgi:hypothetical protein